MPRGFVEKAGVEPLVETRPAAALFASRETARAVRCPGSTPDSPAFFTVHTASDQLPNLCSSEKLESTSAISSRIHELPAEQRLEDLCATKILAGSQVCGKTKAKLDVCVGQIRALPLTRR